MPVCYRVYIEKSYVLFLLPCDRLTRKADSSRRVTNRWIWDEYAGVPSTKHWIRIFKIWYISIKRCGIRSIFVFVRAFEKPIKIVIIIGRGPILTQFVVSVTGYRTFDSFGFIDFFQVYTRYFLECPFRWTSHRWNRRISIVIAIYHVL